MVIKLHYYPIYNIHINYRYNVYKDCSGLLVAGGTTIESSWKVSRVRDS